MNNIKINPYLEEFNKNFGFDLKLQRGEDLEVEIPDNPQIDILEGKDNVLYSVIPFEKTEKKPEFYIGSNWIPKKVIKYQLVGYKYHPARGMNPPETEDFVIKNSRGCDFNSFDQALIHALKLTVEEKFNDMVLFVHESVLDENNLSLEESF